MMLVTFLNVLSCRYYQDQLISPCIRMVTTLLGEWVGPGSGRGRSCACDVLQTLFPTF